MKTDNFRGQAALEYLTTYGWALLIIFIVIAALMVIAPVSTPPTCRFDQVGFSCAIPSINSAGKLFMRVANSNNNDVAIYGIICIGEKSGNMPTFPPSPPTPIATIARQGELDMSTLTPAITCRRSDGSSTYARAEDFTGRVWIKYKNTEDPTTYPERVASAVIATKVA